MSSLNSCDTSDDQEEIFDFASHFSHLLETKTCVDVTFILKTEDGEVGLFAHQLVLAMRSPYFANMFYGDQNKEDMVIRLEKVNPKAFEDMIRYCYDSNPDLERFEEVSSLFKVAYHYKVMGLVNLCHTCLMDMEITPVNVFSMLEISEYNVYLESSELRNTCCEFLEEKTRHVLDSYDMVQITPSIVRVILGLPRLSLYSEYELIKWLFDWANAKVEEGDTVWKNAREFLWNFLRDMNFLDLTFKDFALLCKDYPDFFTLEEIACICLNIAHPGTRELPDWCDKQVKVRKYTGNILRAKLIEKDIMEARKCIKDILAIEEVLTEFLNYMSENDESFEEHRIRFCRAISLNSRIYSAIEECKDKLIRTCETLPKESKTEELETLKKVSENISREENKTFKRAEKLCNSGFEFIEMVDEKEILDRLEKEGNYYSEFDAMRKVLKNVEIISNSYEDDEKTNEKLKKCRPMVIEKIKILSELHDKFQEKLSQLIEEKLQVLSK